MSRPAPAPVAAPRSGTAFTARALLLALVAVVLLTAYTQTLHAWWQQRSEIHALQAQNRATKAEIAVLKEAKQDWEDPAYVRSQARARFGWVMPGEVGYRVIGSDGKLQGGTSSLAEPTEPKTPTWAEKLGRSVVEAGK